MLEDEAVTIGGSQIASQEQVDELGGDAGRAVGGTEPRPHRGLEAGFFHQFALCHLEGILAGLVHQPRRQLDESAQHRVPVLPNHQRPIVLVESEHHRRARMLEHQAPERRLLAATGTPDPVGPERQDPAVTMQVIGGHDRPGLSGVGQVGGREFGHGRGGYRSGVSESPDQVVTPTVPSVTQQEAQLRASLIAVERYDIDLDLRGMVEGSEWAVTSTITFTCEVPGQSTFLDCAADVRGVVLNDIEIDLGSLHTGRIPLTGLAEHNVVTVSSIQSSTAPGASILRAVDPADGLVYVWSSFKPDGARRAWACFDQPDLKAPYRFTVSAPDTWTVTTNSAPESVRDREDGGQEWSFPQTPPLPPHLVVVHAGPFFELREQRGDHSLGLFARQSLHEQLTRDAEDLFAVAEQGLAFFGEHFGLSYPEQPYDQVFVPDPNGARQHPNWACVTWSDSALFRNPPSPNQRESVATMLLHGLAQMWFGNLVTMRWWDDAWLVESLSSWAATWAGERAAGQVDARAGFLAQGKLDGYRADLSPASRPLRVEVADAAQVVTDLDRDTCAKGQAVLSQLVAVVGEPAFLAGLGRHLADHAWSTSTLDDFIASIAEEAELDLSAWAQGWLDRAGTDTLVLMPGPGDAAAPRHLLATSPDGGPPRSHRLAVGSYVRTVDSGHGHAGLDRVALTEVVTHGRTTRVVLPDADLHLVNDGDLTFAAVRPDEDSLQTMLDLAADLPDPLARAQVVATCWDMLARGELSTGEFLDVAVRILLSETCPGVLEPLFDLALTAAERWSPTALVPRRVARVADVAAQRTSSERSAHAAFVTLAASASRPQHFELLATQTPHNLDIAWRVLIREASLGRYDANVVAAMVARDQDPGAELLGWCVDAARPSDAAKTEAWERVFAPPSRIAGLPLARFGQAFWRPVQHELLVPWAERYLAELASMRDEVLPEAIDRIRAMAPTTCAPDWPARALDLAAQSTTHPVIRRELLTAADALQRVLNARA